MPKGVMYTGKAAAEIRSEASPWITLFGIFTGEYTYNNKAEAYMKRRYFYASEQQ